MNSDTKELFYLLLSYFSLIGNGPKPNDLACRLRAIKTLDDLVTIDNDLEDPLWYVVPQIIMHQFGMDAFKNFESRYVTDKSFVFVHPAHSHIVPKLQEALGQHWKVGEPIIYKLTERLICALYGGYRWHSAYAAACKFIGSLGKSATILPLIECSQTALQNLISYKNYNRDRLTKKIVISRHLLNQEMDGVIHAFHCPDMIENLRQMLNIGLVNYSEILDGHTHRWLR